MLHISKHHHIAILTSGSAGSGTEESVRESSQRQKVHHEQKIDLGLAHGGVSVHKVVPFRSDLESSQNAVGSASDVWLKCTGHTVRAFFELSG
jgi:hypothetical protein